MIGRRLSRGMTACALFAGAIGSIDAWAADCVSGQTYSSTTPCTVPTGVTSIAIQVWGDGGGGDDNVNGWGWGGGGGAFCGATLAVTGGQLLSLSVGQGGAGANGTDSAIAGSGSSVTYASNTVIAAGGGSQGGFNLGEPPTGYVGLGGTCGSFGPGTTNVVSFAGGNGGIGFERGDTNAGGGGGGGSGSPTAVGGTGGDGEAGESGSQSGGAGGLGTGAGGAGGAVVDGTANSGQNGLPPGGGGGGGAYSTVDQGSAGLGGTGAAGQIILNFSIATNPVPASSAWSLMALAALVLATGVHLCRWRG